MFKRFEKELVQLKNQSAHRSLKNIKKDGKHIFFEGKKLLNLSSNDYLGIGSDCALAQEFLKTYKASFGSASARLLTGSSEVYAELEELLANIFGKDGALLFNSGYHANIGIFQALLGENSVVFLDKLDHASIIDGVRLSGQDFYRYKHLDYEHLEELLKKHANKYDTVLIASETVFSMDGDIADVKKLVELKNKYGAILILDEAHAFGVFGETGLGIAQRDDVLNQVDLVVATFGKAIGSYGAFVAGSRLLIDYLVNKARPFIFSTAIPEVNVGFSKYVIENILPNTAKERQELLDNSRILRDALAQKGFEVLGESQIVPVVLNENERAQKVSEILMEKGFYLLPIRHPTVAKNSARVRISLNSKITQDDISILVDAFSHLS